MSSPKKLSSSKIAKQVRQMQELLLAALEEERMEVERAKQEAEEKARREAEEQKRRKLEEIRRAKAAKKKLEEAEKKRQEELAEARRGKAREVVPSKRVIEDISDPSDPPFQQESMDSDSEREEKPKAPQRKKRKGNNAQPIASTSSAQPPCARCSEKQLDCRPQDQSNTVSCYYCRKSKVHCSWNDRIKSNPVVGDSALPTDFYERVVWAMEGIQESMFGISFELRQFRLQVASWQDTMLAERSRRARQGEAMEALEIERELEELEEEAEEDQSELIRQIKQAEIEEKEKRAKRSAPK
ncbi:hypothetical protein F5890DRAFT_1649880 [Lentinula detonsa]|uniref:Zn(2)-C6 fungal-type domain-containing protein n=1 Tax=Lentinula detonsa TaxID=2804962 RepID=A0AA38UMK3_9AGAR|nr:hypothetical protein F5890DRAFT_1649880 [Lentinula detonsa]